MPHEYRDDEDRPPPYNSALASEEGVNASGGYNVPVSADQPLAGYKSTAVMLNGNGTAVTVEVGWAHSDDVAGTVMLETKTQDSADPSTLLFVNQGDRLDHVTLTGGANVDYSVVESNQLPLPRSSDESNQWPFEYECIDLGSLGDGTGTIAPTVEYWKNSGWKSVIDATYYRGFYFDSGNVAGKQIVFVLRLGGKGSMWCVQPVVAIGPAEGKLRIEFGQSSHGEDAPGAGDPDDAGIIYDTNALPHPADLVANPVVWKKCLPNEWDLNAAVLRKIDASLGTLSQFRIMGDAGAVLSADAAATFGRGYTARDFNGGPGIWYMRLSNLLGASGQNRVRISSLRVVRQTVFDFISV